MTDDWLALLAASPWALPIMAALVVGDAFLVVIPGEAAVTTFGALAVSTGSPSLFAVIAVAALAAATGDIACYVVGRAIGIQRWRWMRARRVQDAFTWAHAALDRRGGSLMFTARFIPFARLAVNLVAGSSRMSLLRYLPLVAAAATAWAIYQALVGAAVAALIPGGTVAAVLVSIGVALLLGFTVDLIVARVRRRSRAAAGAAVGENGSVTRLPRIAMPARLSDADGADARVGLANAIFDDVAALVRAEDLDVVVVRDADLTGFDGLVLPGGGDVDPARYGGDTAAACYDVNPAQDDLDLDIAAAAVAAGLPILGVCRGLQVLNVSFGGTLVEDLAASDVLHTPGDDGCGELEWTWHPVAVAPGSRLRGDLPADEIAVASGHHQAIRDLGEGLIATATATDGVVEAVEHETLPIVAVQWHPEAEGTPAELAAAPFAVFADLVRAGCLAQR
ncbi:MULTISPECIES: gamma-glutamyl-gamma-aminobutyrate hydrolase family protein [unclassified Microbacterium]|uniref:gamma-glutamyl-gamma-aminobutyrate hydrolase family protein n=1 Tax=unclassified Microbacterium TaxID=2609290 RepID=UPI000AE5C595|nr:MULTISPECIES: gamma-glutamyl-gamma-aminobutyrate hydrolase family protein [unclassified Microbacterium]MBN9214029.1 gamma-glutamyl-gamma-aminobutyrate hydrolase family protein [Microbacterium sp.]